MYIPPGKNESSSRSTSSPTFDFANDFTISYLSNCQIVNLIWHLIFQTNNTVEQCSFSKWWLQSFSKFWFWWSLNNIFLPPPSYPHLEIFAYFNVVTIFFYVSLKLWANFWIWYWVLIHLTSCFYTTCWKDSFSYCLGAFLKNEFILYVWVYFWTPYSVSLIIILFFHQFYTFLNYCSFIVSSKAGSNCVLPPIFFIYKNL